MILAIPILIRKFSFLQIEFRISVKYGGFYLELFRDYENSFLHFSSWSCFDCCGAISSSLVFGFHVLLCLLYLLSRLLSRTKQKKVSSGCKVEEKMINLLWNIPPKIWIVYTGFLVSRKSGIKYIGRIFWKVSESQGNIFFLNLVRENGFHI